MLLHLYSAKSTAGKPALATKPGDEEASRPMNGHPRVPSAMDRQAHDAQEFELEGLMSDDDDENVKHRTNGHAH